MRPATSPSIVAILKKVEVFPYFSFLNYFLTFSFLYIPVLSGFTKQSSECNDGGEAGKVEEEEGRNDLRVEAICEVRQIVRSLPFVRGDRSQLFLFFVKQKY